MTVKGEGIVEVFAWETEPDYALHILNYNNPNMTRGPIRHFYAIGAQQVHFNVEEGSKISSVRALRSGRGLRFTQDSATVHFEVPGVTDYKVVALT